MQDDHDHDHEHEHDHRHGSEGHAPGHDEHVGDFAEGQEGPHQSGGLKGDFAKGQETLAGDEERDHRGEFATGQEGVVHHPEDDPLRGDFARGQEKDPH